MYSKELLHISKIITSLCIHLPQIGPNFTMTAFWNKHLQQDVFCFTEENFVIPQIPYCCMYLKSLFIMYISKLFKHTQTNKMEIFEKSIKRYCRFWQVLLYGYNLLHKRRNLLHQGRHFVSVPNIYNQILNENNFSNTKQCY